MAQDSLLKEILDTLEDPDTVQLFATANGLVGDAEVENRLRELQWDKHIDNLWQEVLSDIESPPKKSVILSMMAINLLQVGRWGAVGKVPILRTH